MLNQLNPILTGEVFFIVNAESRKLCNEVIRFVYEKVKFKINGKWVTGNPLHYNLV